MRPILFRFRHVNKAKKSQRFQLYHVQWGFINQQIVIRKSNHCWQPCFHFCIT